MRTSPLSALVAAAAALVLLPLAVAAGGDLDASFGSGGKVVTDFGADELAWAVAVQRDGKVVAAGRTRGDVAIARYGRDGRLDPGFGRGGRVVTDLGRTDVATELFVQRDGKLVAAGPGFLARYAADGSPDTRFGVGGTVTTGIGGPVRALLRSDGRIVVAGTLGDSGSERFALARYTHAGSLDRSFGRRGRVVTDVRRRPGETVAFRDAVLTRRGKIVAVGVRMHARKRSSADRWPIWTVVVRSRTGGARDRSFGRDGVVLRRLTPDDCCASVVGAVAVQADGKIVVGGRTAAAGATLIRLRNDGSLDRSFGRGGSAANRARIADDVRAMVIDRRGRIVVAGTDTRTFGDFAVTGFTRNGVPHRCFTPAGVVTTDLDGRRDTPLAAALQTDGKLVVAGSAGWTTPAADFGVARYLACGTRP